MHALILASRHLLETLRFSRPNWISLKVLSSRFWSWISGSGLSVFHYSGGHTNGDIPLATHTDDVVGDDCATDVIQFT